MSEVGNRAYLVRIVLVIFTSTGHLGALFAQDLYRSRSMTSASGEGDVSSTRQAADLELLRGELSSPFRVGLGDWVLHGGLGSKS